MDKQLLKQILLDNAQLVEKIEVLPRAYALDESVYYVFTGVHGKIEVIPCWEWLLS